ncbi:MAG: hypothetical protein H0V18_11395 [Pyrinomonadaceae bacterium]|nr:hypothetical protein [Pyrinomonadaceae bacterium]
MLRLKTAYANGVRQFQPRVATLGKGVVNEGKTLKVLPNNVDLSTFRFLV